MIASIQRFARATDGLIARAYPAMSRERGGLLASLFHSPSRDEREIALNQVDPLQRTTVGRSCRFIEYPGRPRDPRMSRDEGEAPRTENEPPMIASIQRFVRATDCLIARAYLAMSRERGGLLAFLFHSLFRDEREIALNQVDPLQRTTVGQFRRFIEYYLEHGYRFISPTDPLRGLSPDGKYALITFDDGYFNNIHALPVLEEYGVPAVFFISTDHVRQNKCFWWDVLYRERVARGASPSRAYREGVALKSKRTEQIEAELTARFGPRAFEPRGDVDRPFSPSELRAFARSPYVHLGNHTANHAILTNYPPEQVRAQILGAQEALREMTGVRPGAIAYPNGAYSRQILEACGDIGLKVGFTVRPEKNPLPLDARSPGLLQLGRFALEGDGLIEAQCRTYRSDLLLYGLFRDGYLKFIRGTPAGPGRRHLPTS